MTRKLSITSGLILFIFVAVHLSNLALGVFSVELVDAVRPTLMAVFANPFSGALLLGVLLIHIVLGLASLYRRNTLHLSRHDSVQLITALLILPLLIPHAWGVIAGQYLLDLSPSYENIFRYFWIDSPLEGLMQVFLVVTIWVHGCVGLFTWLKLQSWWSRWSALIYPFAVAIPVMALLGFVEGGNSVLPDPSVERAIVQSDAYSNDYGDAYSSSATGSEVEQTPAPSDKAALFEFVKTVKWQLVAGYVLLLMILLALRYLRVRSNTELVEVHYATGQRLRREVGPTLLELADINDIPHASLCRGRGRCGTCRVKVFESDSPLKPPSSIEQATLARTDSPPDVRLACQLTPGPGTIRIERLLAPDLHAEALRVEQQKKPDSTADRPDPEDTPQEVMS